MFAPAVRWARTLSLTSRFGLVSAALVAILGIVLGSWSASRIRRANIDESVRLIAFAKTTTLYTLGHLRGAELPQNPQVQAALGKTIVDAALQSKRIVGLVVWQGRQVLYASAPLGATAAQHPPQDLAPALAGATKTRLISSQGKTSDPGVRALIAGSGPLLQVMLTVPGGPGASNAAVQAFLPWRPVEKNISHEIFITGLVLLIGLTIFWLVLLRLVTRASRSLREQADHNRKLADHDPLTGLPNREMARRQAAEAIKRAERTDRTVGLLLFDLDRFKEINDTLGHHIGDLLLREIGPRLAEGLRDGDCIGRLGGDEFVVLLPDLPDALHAVTLGRRLRERLSAPFVLEGVSLVVEASMGVAAFPEHGADFSTLLQHADVAMYVAKKANVGLSVYDPVLDEHSPMRLALVGELRDALNDPAQFELHYQPKANMRTGLLTGFEALVRWRHPQRGLLVPDEFIPTAERTGMIRALTRIVLEKAVEQQKAWKQAGLNTPIAVNISTRCLLDPELVDDVAQLLLEHEVSGSEIDLEITESAIMADPERAEQVLNRLVGLGVGIAIDDFGTGYSSMAHLRRLPIHQIKIDKSFVVDLTNSASDAAIVRSMVELARNLGLGVVAEGVETEETWQHLFEFGCTTAQGYYLSRPLPADQVLPWIGSRAGAGLGTHDGDAGEEAATFAGHAGAGIPIARAASARSS